MPNENFDVMQEEQNNFTPTAKVRDSNKLLGKSVELDLIVGKDVTIDIIRYKINH